MATASKEVLEKYSGVFEKQIFHTVIHNEGFISLYYNGVEHIRFQDVFISCYQSLMNKYQSQSDELRLSNNLEF